MYQAILKFLQNAAKKVATGLKSSLTTKEGLKTLGKNLLKETAPGQLYEAFKGKPSLSTLGGSSQQGQAPQTSGIDPNKIMGSSSGGQQDQGILGFLGQSGVSNSSGQTTQSSPRLNLIPAQYQNFVRDPGMTFGNQAINSYTPIPEQYQSLLSPKQPQQQIGAMRGFIDESLGMPQPEGLAEAPQGRRTAYAAGGLIPRVIMSKLGQPSAAEATTREATNQYYNAIGGQTGEEGFSRVWIGKDGQPVPAGTPGAIPYDKKLNRGGGSDLTPAKTLGQEENFQLEMNQAVEAIQAGQDPDKIKQELQRKFGNKLKEIDMIDRYL